MRDVFVAEAPAWKARRLTSYDKDDAQELTSLKLSADGRHVVYVRGGDHGWNWDDGLPVNPAAVGAPTTVGVCVGGVRRRRRSCAAAAASRGGAGGGVAASRRSGRPGRLRSTDRRRPRSCSRRAARTAASSGRPTARALLATERDILRQAAKYFAGETRW